VVPHGLNQAEYLEGMKEYGKSLNHARNRAKLYEHILKYLSNESLEEVKRVANWAIIEAHIDPSLLWTE
jgi:hypothetical protein